MSGRIEERYKTIERLTIEDQVSILSQLVYRGRQVAEEEDTAVIPILEHLRHGISIGPGSKNMAEGFERHNIPEVIARIEYFLQRLGMPSLADSFLMLNPRPGEPQIVDITEEMVQTAKARPLAREDIETDLRASALVTTIPHTPLMVKPADCPSPIVYGVTSRKQPVLAIVHAGRAELNSLLPQQVVEHLVEKYGCAPEEILVGIPPGISPEHYSIPRGEKNLINEISWQNYMYVHVLEGEELIHLDLLGNIVNQLTRMGVLQRNIQAYGHNVDTYALAARTPPFALSQRYATETQQPHRNGRLLVVASL